jgi:hypothetical protein
MLDEEFAEYESLVEEPEEERGCGEGFVDSEGFIVV